MLAVSDDLRQRMRAAGARQNGPLRRTKCAFDRARCGRRQVWVGNRAGRYVAVSRYVRVMDVVVLGLDVDLIPAPNEYVNLPRLAWGERGNHCPDSRQ